MEVRPIDANALKLYFSDRQMEYVSLVTGSRRLSEQERGSENEKT